MKKKRAVAVLAIVGFTLLISAVAHAQSDELTPEEEIQRATEERRAAEQGDAQAQMGLGVMYRLGAGVPRDYVAAYAWLSVAAVREEAADYLRFTLESELTADQLIAANRLAREIWERIEWPWLYREVRG